MKIGLFSDSHYCNEVSPQPTRLTHLSYGKINKAMEDFKANRVDLVMCLGDMGDVIDDPENGKKSLQELVSMIRSYDIPFLFVTGNHDFCVAGIEDIEELIGIPVPPMTYDTEEYRIICLDANYESNMKHFSPEGFDWTDANVPKEQLVYLEQALKSTEKQCIVALHGPIDRAMAERSPLGKWASVKNAAEVRDIVEKSGKVKLVLSGHVHNYYNVCENGIRYISVHGICEGTSNHYMILDWNQSGYEVIVKSKERFGEK